MVFAGAANLALQDHKSPQEARDPGNCADNAFPKEPFKPSPLPVLRLGRQERFHENAGFAHDTGRMSPRPAPRPTVAPLRLLAGAALAVSACGLAGMPADAATRRQPKVFHGDYTVSILGLTVARSSFTTRINGDRFLVEGSLSSAGLAELFDDTKGTTTVSGVFFDDVAWPRIFRTQYTSGKKKQFTEISFSQGAVTKTVNVPPLKARGKDWVKVSPGDLAAVADPLSATLIRAAKPDEVCKRRVKMYDGEMRADLALSHVSTGETTVGGYTGPVVTCSARFLPVSGYRKGRKQIDFLKNRSDIKIAFAQLGTTGVYAPVQATVGTEIGTLTIEAGRFEAED